MTPADIGKLTLDEVQAIADRAQSTLSALRAVMSLLPGVGGVAVVSAPSAPAETNKGPIAWSPEELAQREAIRQQRMAEMPERVKLAGE